MSGHARRSRLVALGLSIGTLAGLVTGMVATEHPRAVPATEHPRAVPATEHPRAVSATEHPRAVPATEGPTVAAPDPFTTGRPATPPSSTPGNRFRQTITSAS